MRFRVHGSGLIASRFFSLPLIPFRFDVCLEEKEDNSDGIIAIEILVLLLAWVCYLKMYRVLYSTQGSAYHFSS